MTLEELAVLPTGTKIKLDMRPEPGFDRGVITHGGAIAYIHWLATQGMPPVDRIIHTASVTWAEYVADMSIDND